MRISDWSSDVCSSDLSGQWSWAGKDTHILLGVHAIRAMDLIRIKTSRSHHLQVEDVAADHVRQFLDIYDKTNHPSVSNHTVQRIRASCTKPTIHPRYDSNTIVVRGFRWSDLGQNKARRDIPVCIAHYADVHHAL